MVLALVAIALSFATIAPALDHNIAEAAGSQNLDSNNCSEGVIREKIDAIYNKIDHSKAKSLAPDNDKFKAAKKDHTARFEQLSTTWTADESTCEVTLDGVHLLYSLTGSNGKFVRNIMVNEDKEMMQVVSIDEQEVVYYADRDSQNYSGYYFKANSGATIPVYIAKTTFSVPAISQPYSGACTTSQSCHIAQWTGLADASPNTPGILAQAGTDSILTSGTGTPTYVAWYEFLPAAAVFAPSSFPVTSGSPMHIEVKNNAYNGGSSSSYEVYMKTVSGGSNKYWISIGISYPSLTSPKWSLYITERPTLSSGSLATLGKFSTINVGGEMWYSGGYNGIQTPYNAGYRDKITMKNGSGTTLISTGAVSSSTFTQTWLTSAGT